MKAKQYFAKYGTLLTPVTGPDLARKIGWDIYCDFARELIKMAKDRHIVSDKGYNAIVRELNLKWNSLATLFSMKYKVPLLQFDGFYWITSQINIDAINQNGVFKQQGQTSLTTTKKEKNNG